MSRTFRSLCNYRSSPPDRWTHPRGKDARHMTHGPIEPLDPDDALIAGLGPVMRMVSRAVTFVALGTVVLFAASLVWGLAL